MRTSLVQCNQSQTYSLITMPFLLTPSIAATIPTVVVVAAVVVAAVVVVAAIIVVTDIIDCCY